jgi:predicted metal-dependent peptidase
MDANANAEKRLESSRLRLRAFAPFLGTLTLFAELLLDEHMPTAATDGKRILFNPRFVEGLSSHQLDAVMMHEVLHAALRHVTRRGTRDPHMWNVAADVVVNGIIGAEPGHYELPRGAIKMPDLEALSVEEVYAVLQKDPSRCPPMTPALQDLMPSPGASEADNEAMDRYWRQALQHAATIGKDKLHGREGAGWLREVNAALGNQVDWRTMLWQHVARTPSDFGDFDRRFMHRKLYLETLEIETLNAYVCIDTSGSVDGATLGLFLGELRSLVRAYPSVHARLFYADAALYGPHDLFRADDPVPAPKGGGGTSFKPFFEWVDKHPPDEGMGVMVYLTDGFGDFPKDAPDLPTLWVVCPGGAKDEVFPFGGVARLV